MKLSNLVKGSKKPRLKIIVTEAQFSRLVENLNILNENKCNELIERKKDGKY